MQEHILSRARHAGIRCGLVAMALAGCGQRTDVSGEISIEPSTPTAPTAPTAPTDTAVTRPEATALDCEPAAVTDQVALLQRRYRELPGVNPALLSLDVYGPLVPRGCPAVPIVVYVHGGNFERGDKSERLEPKVDLLNGAGYAVVSVNHRLVGDDRSGAAGVAYPAQADDLAAAIAWAVEFAERYSADPERLALVGHSSGGFLVAQQATQPRHLTGAGLDPSVVRCAALLDPEPLDVPAQIEIGNDQSTLYRTMFGDDPDTWQLASPQRGAEDGTVSADFLIVSRGSDQRTLPAARFAEAVRSHGNEVVEVDAGELGGVDVDAAVGDKDDTVVTPVLLSFLDRCLG